MKSLCLACQSEPGCLFSPRGPLPVGRAQGQAEDEAQLSFPNTAPPTRPTTTHTAQPPLCLEMEDLSSSAKQLFYEQHLIIHPFKAFCIINP